MNRKEREIKGKDQIKIDIEIPKNGGGEHKGASNKRVVKDNTKLIIALVLLVVIVLMAILRAHPVASIITAIPIGVLNYLIYRDK